MNIRSFTYDSELINSVYQNANFCKKTAILKMFYVVFLLV